MGGRSGFCSERIRHEVYVQEGRFMPQLPRRARFRRRPIDLRRPLFNGLRVDLVRGASDVRDCSVWLARDMGRGGRGSLSDVSLGSMVAREPAGGM